MSTPFKYISTDAEANKILSQHTIHGHVGLDIEWKPNRHGDQHNEVAMLQLATGTETFLIHVAKIGHLPTIVTNLLESPLIWKAGVGIQEDVKKLHRDFHVSITSCVDLSMLALSIDCLQFEERTGIYSAIPRGIENTAEKHRTYKGHIKRAIALSKLAKSYAGMELTKNNAMTDWEKKDLTQEEKESNDAHAGFAILKGLLQTMRYELGGIPDRWPKRLFFCFDCIDGVLYEPRSPEERVFESDCYTIKLSSIAACSDAHGRPPTTPWLPSNPEYDSATSAMETVVFGDPPLVDINKTADKLGYTVTYAASKEGPPHDPVWTVVYELNGQTQGKGTGRSMQIATHAAATDAWLNKRNWPRI
ncbi:hypothetical protein MPER_13270 [Moniliophthora perniciosa FA553]|nr:hypothetical protein MPER_13270 [Moniliophthora perniciosa FA553]